MMRTDEQLLEDIAQGERMLLEKRSAISKKHIRALNDWDRKELERRRAERLMNDGGNIEHARETV